VTDIGVQSAGAAMPQNQSTSTRKYLLTLTVAASLVLGTILGFMAATHLVHFDALSSNNRALARLDNENSSALYKRELENAVDDLANVRAKQKRQTFELANTRILLFKLASMLFLMEDKNLGQDENAIAMKIQSELRKSSAYVIDGEMATTLDTIDTFIENNAVNASRGAATSGAETRPKVVISDARFALICDDIAGDFVGDNCKVLRGSSASDYRDLLKHCYIEAVEHVKRFGANHHVNLLLGSDLFNRPDNIQWSGYIDSSTENKAGFFIMKPTLGPPEENSVARVTLSTRDWYQAGQRVRVIGSASFSTDHFAITASAVSPETCGSNGYPKSD
jgi:hypothetical protein